jgi:hypothetical protein
MNILKGLINWLWSDGLYPVFGNNHDILIWACQYGTAATVRAQLAKTRVNCWNYYLEYARNVDIALALLDDPRIRLTYNALFKAIQSENDDMIRVLLADDRVERLLTYSSFRPENIPGTQLHAFLQRERIRQSLVLAWIGTELGQGWKDIMCDVVVKYIGSRSGPPAE